MEGCGCGLWGCGVYGQGVRGFMGVWVWFMGCGGGVRGRWLPRGCGVYGDGGGMRGAGCTGEEVRGGYGGVAPKGVRYAGGRQGCGGCGSQGGRQGWYGVCRVCGARGGRGAVCGGGGVYGCAVCGVYGEGCGGFMGVRFMGVRGVGGGAGGWVQVYFRTSSMVVDPLKMQRSPSFRSVFMPSSTALCWRMGMGDSWSMSSRMEGEIIISSKRPWRPL